MILVVVLSFASFYSNAATASEFSNANSAINSAFSAVYNAEGDGGNVTVQINELNTALALVDRAQAENSTNPSHALADLQNATLIATQVSNQSGAVSQAGAAARQVEDEESIGSAIAILVVALLIYLYAGRIYRRAWLFAYRNHVVKRSSG